MSKDFGYACVWMNLNILETSNTGECTTATITFKVLDVQKLIANAGETIYIELFNNDFNINKDGKLYYYQDVADGYTDNVIPLTFNFTPIVIKVIPSEGYTVGSDMQGHGTQTADITGIAYESTIIAPAAPAEAGWVFGGWYKEAACTNAWNFATDKVTADVTLYAKWIDEALAVNYTVEHYQQNLADDNFTKFETESYTAEIGDVVAIMVQEYTGFTADAALTTINDAPIPDPLVIVDGDVIKVYYTRNIYTVSFNGNGNTGGTVPASIVAKYGATITIPNQTPTKTGFVFDYWLGSVVMPGDEYTVTQDKELVAQWKAESPKPAAPDTGDENHIALYTGLAAVALCGLAAVLVIRRRRRSGEGNAQ